MTEALNDPHTVEAAERTDASLDFPGIRHFSRGVKFPLNETRYRGRR